MTSLEVNNLCKSYPGFELKNVSFCIEDGTVMGFIGKNGAGKSTTIKAMLNIIPKDGGTVKVCGKDYSTNESICKSQIGLVLGGIDFYPKKKLKTIASVVSDFYKNDWNNEKYNKYMDFFGLDENKHSDELSNGMKVKFMLVLALSHNAKLLILDEPTSGLDPVARDELCAIFRQLVKNKERSIMFSTHITSDLEKCATHITFIKDGILQRSLPVKDFIESYAGTGDISAEPSLEDIIVSVERREIDDKVFD